MENTLRVAGSPWRFFMKRLCLFLLTSLLATGAHAASTLSSGAITFHGAVWRYTTLLSQNDVDDRLRVGTTTSIWPVSKAHTMLFSDVLNYFATYAKTDALLVSTTYQ
jgi:hypothetical protein